MEKIILPRGVSSITLLGEDEEQKPDPNEAAWHASAALQAEFTTAAIYAAFVRGSETHTVRISGGGVAR